MNEVLTQLREGKLAGAKRLDLSCHLREFPREIFDLEDSLEVLNLSQNQLFTLPDDLGRLKKLRILFCSSNAFTTLPEVLGSCPALTMVGFRANAIAEVPEASLPEPLQWLILTENQLASLPPAIGRCARLQKLMLTGNRLHALPEEIAGCSALEMARLAANDFQDVPAVLKTLPKLAWLAMAGNPCAAWNEPTGAHEPASWESVRLQAKLGEGASGIVHRASWQGQEVAVKAFKHAVTSDGLATSEIAASLRAGSHPHLIGALAEIADSLEERPGLIMPLMSADYQSLAGPPSFATCTRDVYDPALRLTSAQARALALGMAHAALHLHSQGVMHGDFYAHNMLWQPGGACVLGDLGAAWPYQPSRDAWLEKVEVRAWGIFVQELLACVESPQDGWSALAEAAQATSLEARPAFAELVRQLG